MRALFGWILVAVLAAAAVWGIWFFPSDALRESPETPAVAQAAPEKASAASAQEPSLEELERRFERFASLRVAGDWPAVYDLTDPEQRRVLDLATFLDIYAHGMVDMLEMTLLGVEPDESGQEATVRLHQVGELVVDKLPPRERAAFRMPEDPAALQRPKETTLRWVWRDGEWYWRVPEDAAYRQALGS